MNYVDEGELNMKKTFFTLLVCMLFVICVPSFAAEEGTNKTIKLDTKIYDELDSYNEVDYFNFRLTKPGSIKIDFDFDVEGQYVVKLINTSNDKVIQNLNFSSQVNTASGRYSKSGNKVRVDKGNYTVSVTSYSRNFCDEEYKLKVNYDAEAGDNYEKESNNSAKEAMIIDYNMKVTGNLESNNDTDFYMLELYHPGTIQMRLNYKKDSGYTGW